MLNLHRKLRAALLVLLLLASVFTALGPTAAAATDRTPVLVLRGASGLGGPEEAYPAAVGDELGGLLSAGGLRNVRQAEVATGGGLLDAIRGADAVHLVVVAHGAPAGLVVGGELVPWRVLRAALSESGARYVYLAACHSAMLGEVAGKTVVTAFGGEVDHRVVAPQVASDMFAAAFPVLDAGFERVLLAHLEARGGLDRYGRLLLMPELTLQESCAEKLDRWHGGQAGEASAGECVYYLSSANLNCHAEPARREPPCTEYTPSEQSQLNRESTPYGEASYGDDSWQGSQAGAGNFQGAYWDAIAKALSLDFRVNGNDVNIKVGKDLSSHCVTLVRAETFLSGGLASLMQAAKSALAARAGGRFLAADGSILAMRLCGSLDISVPGYAHQPQAEARVGASGALDVRVSAFGAFSLDVRVFRWTRTVSIDFETGLSYPIKLGVFGGIRWCYNPDGSPASIYWRVSVPLEAGGLGFFAQTTLGWGQMGFRHDFTDKWAPTFESTGWCPSGTSFSPPRGGSGTQADPSGPLAMAPLALPAAYQRLVAMGLAVENPAPTVFAVGERQEATLTAGILEMRPGTGTFNQHLADGALDRLGVPATLPADSVVLLDMTHPGVQEALGLPRQGVVPRVGLVDGVAILGGTTAAGPATEEFCGVPVDALVLRANACAGFSAEPYPILRTDAQAGVVVLNPDAGDLSLALDAFTGAQNDAYGAACRPGAVYPLLRAACMDGRTLASGGTALTDIDLLADIHESFTLLQRPAEAAWMVTGCRIDYFGLDLGAAGGVNAEGPVVEPDGSVDWGGNAASACMKPSSDDYGGAILDAKQAQDEFILGQAILGVLAAHSWQRAQASVSKPLETLDGTPDVVGTVWSQACGYVNGC